MSLINDALKQARQAAPDNSPGSLKPLQPVPSHHSPGPSWFLPVVVVLLLVIGALLIGWVVLRHSNHEDATKTTPPPTVAATPVPAPAPTPVVTPPPKVAVSIPTPPPVALVAQPAVGKPPEPAPPAQTYPPIDFKLQGIDYSPRSPSAILNGRTISPGDMFHQYRVKSISPTTVTLVGPDNRETNLEIAN